METPTRARAARTLRHAAYGVLATRRRPRGRAPGRRPHRARRLARAGGRLDGHRPDADPAQGVGDPAVRHRRQAGAGRLGHRRRAAARRRRGHRRRPSRDRRACSSSSGLAGVAGVLAVLRPGSGPLRHRSCPGRRGRRRHLAVVAAPRRRPGPRRSVAGGRRSEPARGRAGNRRPRRGRSGHGGARSLGDVVPPRRDRHRAAGCHRPRAVLPAGPGGDVRRHQPAAHARTPTSTASTPGSRSRPSTSTRGRSPSTATSSRRSR